MSSDIAIKVEDVSKCYLIFDKPGERLKQSIVPRLQRLCGQSPSTYYREFWALKNASLEVKRGEVFGIVGRNGSGKSTLLQIIAGTLEPTAGTVAVKGRVAALLELGAGFNPEFTGRENVYSYAAVLGLANSEIDRRFDEIAAFADIGTFIDQPLKMYSSGMFVRLAFAVTACLDPDVLIIDEAMAVGDAAFQAKCFRRFDELLARGTTILFVSHATEQVLRHCSRALLLENGQVLEMGDPRLVCNRYLDLIFGVPRREETIDDSEALAETPFVAAGRLEERPGYNRTEYRWGSGGAELVDCVPSCKGVVTNSWIAGFPLDLEMLVRFRKDVHRPIYGVTIKTPDGITVYGSNSRDFASGPIWQTMKTGNTCKAKFRLHHHLCPGEYLISLGVAEDIEGEIVPLDRRYDVITLNVGGQRFVGFGLADLAMEVTLSV